MSNKTLLVLAVAALVIVGLVVVILRPDHSLFGASTTPNCSGSTSCTSGDYQVAGTFYLGGTATSSFGQYVSTGYCNTGTSTEFAVLNPFNATSTATVENIVGVGQATTSILQVGTSTAASGLGATSVYPILINTIIGTSSPSFFTSSGLLYGPITGYASSGAATVRTIVVAPSEYIAGYSTSTYGDAGALNYSPALASCSYKILWGE